MIIRKFFVCLLQIDNEGAQSLRPARQVHDPIKLLDIAVVVDAECVDEQRLVHRVLQRVRLQVVREQRVRFPGVEEAARADLDQGLVVSHLIN